MLVAAVSMAMATLQGAQGSGQGGQTPRKVPNIQKVRDNLYWIPGFEPGTPDFNGSNTWAFVMERGVALVDTKNPGMGQTILEQLRTVTDKPVTLLLNTHTHADHTGSNEFFGANVEIVVQENTKANMAKMPNFSGDKATFLPRKTFHDKMSLFSGKDRIDFHYFGPAHTNGDAWIVFPALRAMATGDAFGREATPLIDTNNGGSPLQFHETVAKAAASIKNVDMILTGHAGKVLQWQALVDHAEFNRMFFEETRKSFKAGKTVDQAAAELKLPARFEGYNMGRLKDNVGKIYAELPKSR
jgi:glyoxylase-like metal-dependent hydrolase (beta-lactamase superfamily II)